MCDRVIVATDSDEVAEVVRGFGGEAALTSPDHPSGTDRVAEVAAAIPGVEVVLNVQGDEPLVEAEHLEAAVGLIRADGWAIGTLATPLRSHDAWGDPSVVKVVRGDGGRALYFSRAAIPFQRDGAPAEDELSAAPFLRHLGLYAYRPDALERWVSLPESKLERLERLEQLRPLEAGLSIGVAVVDHAERGVDTAEDATRAERLLAATSGSTPSTHAHADA